MSSSSEANLRLDWPGVLRSEATKLRTMRSNFILLGLATLIMVGISVMFSIDAVTSIRGGIFGGDPADLDVTWLSLQGVFLAQFAVGVMGVLAVTGEYSSGLIRPTLTTVPKRVPVLTAKATVIVLATLAVMLPVAFGSFLLAQGLLAPEGLDVTLAEPGVFRAVVGVALYMAMIAALGSGFGWLLRSAAGAIFALVAVTIVLPLVLDMVDLDWVRTIADYLPSTAGQSIYGVNADNPFESALGLSGTGFGPWKGFSVLVAWVAVGLVASALMLRRRDV